MTAVEPRPGDAPDPSGTDVSAQAAEATPAEPAYEWPQDPEPRPNPIGLIALLVGAIALGFWIGFSAFWIIGALLGTIFLHELGHFLAARWGGMKATRFFIGFGPTMWSFKPGETEYGVKPIPAGAFVKIIGMSNLEEVHPADEARSYRQASFPRRLAVAVAGSAMHFLQALILIAVYLAMVGTPGGVSLFSEVLPRQIGFVVEGSAADQAGFVEGDVLLSLDGQSAYDWNDVMAYVSTRPGEAVDIVAERNGEEFSETVTIGVNEDDPSRGLFGVAPALRERETRSVPAAVIETPGTFWAGTAQSVGFLGQLLSPSGVTNLVALVGEADDPEPPPRSSASPAVEGADENLRPTSIVGIVQIGKDMGWRDLVFLMILLNIFIGVFNLLPTLPFDGGHVVIAVYERIREAIHGGPERYFADVSKLLPLTYVVVFLLVGLGLSTIYLDIRNPLTG